MYKDHYYTLAKSSRDDKSFEMCKFEEDEKSADFSNYGIFNYLVGK